jgi:hypothetical protein
MQHPADEDLGNEALHSRQQMLESIMVLRDLEDEYSQHWDSNITLLLGMS